MRRRALLAGVGLSSVGVGAAFGSGAFTTVEADRSVELGVKNDADARIGFEKNENGAGQIIETTSEGSSASVVKFAQDDLNEQAKTSFLKALTVTNNGTGSSAPDVDLYVEDGDLLGGEWDSDDGDESEDDILDFREHDGSSIVGTDNSITLNAGADGDDRGDSVNVDVVVDLRNGGDKTALEGIEKVTFVAEAVDN